MSIRDLIYQERISEAIRYSNRTGVERLYIEYHTKNLEAPERFRIQDSGWAFRSSDEYMNYGSRSSETGNGGETGGDFHYLASGNFYDYGNTHPYNMFIPYNYEDSGEGNYMRYMYRCEYPWRMER